MSDFGLRLGIEGEREFKKALSEINQSFKVLGSEMKVVTSQFDKNDNSVQALTARNQVLNKEIEAQKHKIETLGNALQNASESFGENDRRTQNWQIQLNNATAALNDMERELGRNTEALDEAGREMDDVAGSADEMCEEIDDAGDAAEKSKGKFEKFGGVLRGIGAAVGAVAVAAGAAAVALGKEAITAYAEYEQLIGGVDTLFKESSEELQKYASKAYKTAGLSANDYMETVTSFSASLIQVLGGDTEKAAEYADMAITDMSDNANKMGTDMSMIQNAYQGFAKQNYTMLDNLKLGYGGTKSEMQRLLSDAQKISGVKYDISNLNEVYQAIHVIQGEMGITGTTAKEASTTIEGSLNSMKSAWSNLLTGIADDNADFGGLIDNFADSVITAAGNLLPRIKTVLQGIGGLVYGLVSGLLPQVLEMGTDLIMELSKGLVNSLPLIIGVGIQAILSLIQGIGEALPELIPVCIDAVLTIADGLLDNIDLLVDAAIALMIGLTDGLIEAMPLLLDKIPIIIEKLAAAIINNLPKIAEAGGQLVGRLAMGIIASVPKAINAVLNIYAAIRQTVASFRNSILDIGKNLMMGIWEGISSRIEWLKNQLKGFGNTILNSIKGVFGIHSPSALFRDEIGSNLALGLGEGFSETMRKVADDMQASIPAGFDTGMAAVNSISTINHTGTIRVEGVSDDGTFNRVVDIVIGQLHREARLA